MVSIQVALGRAIRRLREQAGYSQERFAGVCGLHRTYMTSVETGKRNVSLAIIERIANALELDTGELLSEAESERKLTKEPVKPPISKKHLVPGKNS